jgi:hypothetical protein
MTLAACNSAKEPAAPASAEPSAAPSEDADAAAAAALVGTYEETGKDGKIVTTVIKDDLTYTESTDGKVTESGKASHKDGKDCFDPDGDDAPTRCFTTGEMGKDGTFTATRDGKSITVKKIK